jgi:hypothetical protein
MQKVQTKFEPFFLCQAEESLLSDAQIQTKKKACEAGLLLHCDSGS